MPYTWPPKDPDEVLDYLHNWGPRLDGDTVVGTPTATVDTGAVTVDSTDCTPEGLQTVWLSGGTVGDVKLTLHITTAGGRTFEEGIKLKIKER